MAGEKEVLLFGQWQKRGYLPTAEGVCICECPVHGRLTERQIAAIVLVVVEAHGEEFSADTHLTREEVRATVLALLAEKPELFDGAVGQNGHGPTHDKIKDAVRHFMREHRDEFQGPVGERGPRGFTGPMGERGFPGRSPTAGEIGAAVSAYYSVRARMLDPEQYMREAIAAYRATHPVEYGQPVLRRGFWSRAAVPLVAALAGAALAVAIVALFLPSQPSAGEVAAALKGDPAFVATVTGATGAAGPKGDMGPVGLAGKDVTPVQTAGVLMADPSFLTSVKGKDGASGLQGPAGSAGLAGKDGAPGSRGPAGPAGIQGPPGQSGGGLERLASCSATWLPHVGRTAGWYYRCPDGTEFTLPMGGSLTLQEAHVRLQGKYP